jgi:Trk K+ transport system NAD-binding subunit
MKVTRRHSNQSLFRRWLASWRDTIVLLRQFRTPLLIFVAALLGAGALYQQLSARFAEPVDGYIAAVYLMLTIAFLQPSAEFPHHPALQVFYFVMPVIGVLTLAQGLADFGIMLFNRRARSKEWEMAIASTFSNHIILIGLGHLGYRVVEKLHLLGEAVVVIELDPSADLVNTTQKMGIPVIQEDATRPTALEAAGVARARAIVLCTQNDAMNLKIAVKARSMNPHIQVIIRIFDDDFAQSLQEQFGFVAMSATAMAAPAFAAAAAGADITNPITVEGQSLSLSRLQVRRNSALIGQSVGEVEKNYDISIVLIKDDQFQDMHPPAERRIELNQTLVALGGSSQLNQLIRDN